MQRALLEQYEYDGLETCAADGTCEIACPLGIDTGTLVKGFRGASTASAPSAAAGGWPRLGGGREGRARGLRAGGAAGRRCGGAARSRALLSDELPRPGRGARCRPAPAKLPETSRHGAAAVYMPSCVNRIFGRAARRRNPPGGGGGGLVAVRVAGLPVWIPEDVAGHCCAVPWSSKGFGDGAEPMANRTVEALWRWSDGARCRW